MSEAWRDHRTKNSDVQLSAHPQSPMEELIDSKKVLAFFISCITAY